MQTSQLSLQYSALAQEMAIKLLPQSAQIICELIGLDRTILLIEMRGGSRLSIPKKVRADHPLVPVIGIEALESLSKYFSGEEIEIAKASRLKNFLFGIKVHQEHSEGCSNAQLARKYGYTERGIRDIRKRIKSYLTPC